MGSKIEPNLSASQLIADAEPATKGASELPAKIVLEFRCDALLKRMSAIGPQISASLEQIRTRVTEFAEAVQATMTAFASQFENLRPAIAEILQAFEQWPPAQRGALLMLGRAGWFMDREMSLSGPIEFAQLFADGKDAEAEQALATYFEGRLDEIEESLLKALPSRAKVLASAFAAHRAGQYDLSIPVLLAQTDGICKELAGGYLFMGQQRKKGVKTDQSLEGKPGTAAFVEAMASEVMWSAMLSPLGERLPINAIESERGPNFSQLNRHQVLHGESVSYGTRVNGLKAISLISYAAWVLGESKPATASTAAKLPSSESV